MLRTYAHTFNNRNIYRDPSICSTWILSEWILRRNSSAGVICSDIGVRVSYCGTNTCDIPAEKWPWFLRIDLEHYDTVHFHEELRNALNSLLISGCDAKSTLGEKISENPISPFEASNVDTMDKTSILLRQINDNYHMEILLSGLTYIGRESKNMDLVHRIHRLLRGKLGTFIRNPSGARKNTHQILIEKAKKELETNILLHYDQISKNW